MIRRASMVALALMLCIPLLAEGASARDQRANDRVPSAQLQAAGSGAITVSGRLVVNGTIPGHGSVVVIDRGGDARVHLAGRPQQFNRRHRVRVRQASGILFVRGSNVLVQVLGIDLAFGIAGNGRARLQGTGTYRLNFAPEKSWAAEWFRVAPSSSAERRRSRRCANCSSSAALLR